MGLHRHRRGAGSPGAGGLLRHMGLRSAAALVVANIIGAGIFTTTGFQAADLGHPGWILFLWLVGGGLACAGALCYAELGASMPRAGGEYVYLRETYGPAFGVMSAVVSLVAGFSAPIAAALKSLVRYLGYFFPVLRDDPRVLSYLHLNDLVAIALAWLLVAIHLQGRRGGTTFNDLATLLKVGGIGAILLAAVVIGRGDWSHLSTVSAIHYPQAPSQRLAALGTSLIFVMFCYSGWNAAAYVASEIRDPKKSLPRALLLGTAVVVVLYLGLNAVYLYAAGVDELAGRVEVGLVASRRLFGPWGITLTTSVLSLSILASASAMTVAGPRVYYALGRDFRLLGSLARVRATTGAPSTSLLLQAVVTSVVILSGRVDQIQQYAGFTLSLFASLAVSCVLILRRRRPELPRPFRTWGYPVTPILFLAVSLWTMFWAFRGRPIESSLSLLTVAAGGALFYLLASRDKGRRRE